MWSQQHEIPFLFHKIPAQANAAVFAMPLLAVIRSCELSSPWSPTHRPDVSKLYVDVGFGFHVEMTLEEVLAFIPKRVLHLEKYAPDSMPCTPHPCFWLGCEVVRVFLSIPDARKTGACGAAGAVLANSSRATLHTGSPRI
jgi:hypothetical protein